MCGIAGYFGPGELNETRMLALLRHRGPDARGAWRTPLPHQVKLQLLHTRLKIIDLSEAAAQPMLLNRETAPDAPDHRWGLAYGTASLPTAGEDGRELLVLSFNGEIYNFSALRAELEARGHRFRGKGDTEVLLHGYAEWGVKIFVRLDGMFAVAIYDGPRQQLILARDHTGIKPLYHVRTRDGGLLFASEVRAIAASGLCANHVDPVSMADYLRFGSCQEPRTIMAGVRAFPPGHFGVVRLDEGSPAALITQAYWLHSHQASVPPPNEKNWAEEHRACLAATVKEQLVSDVPLGVFLSGGVDSTLLLELAAAAGKERIVAFTLGGKMTEHNEGTIAIESARNAGVHHLLVQLDDQEVASWVQDGLAAMDQPSSDGMNTYLVSRAARKEGLVTVLSGTGADELHGAYGHAKKLAQMIRWVEAAGRLRGPVTRLAVAGTRLVGGEVQADRLAGMLAAIPSSWRIDQEKRRFFTPAQIAELWPAGVNVAAGWAPPFSNKDTFFSQGLREQIRLSEIRGYLLNTLLRDCDWATMGNQQELRVPFLGRRYMECVLRAPERMTAACGGPKPQLVGMLSPSARRLATLPKRGFTMDYLSWLNGPLKSEFIRATKVLNDCSGFSLDAAARLGSLQQSGSQKEARRVWALLALGRYIAANGLTTQSQ